jgi:hypothetical protein
MRTSKYGPTPKRRDSGAILGGALVGAAVLAYALWGRKNPSACPYALRSFVELPHPFITRARLREVLDPKPGDRVLEVGPGTGYYALHGGWSRGVRSPYWTSSRRCSTTRRAGRARWASRTSSRPGTTPKRSRTRTEPSTQPT